MAIGVIWYPEVDQQAYEAVREKAWQGGTEKGLTFHAAGEGDGRWRIFEVWESRDGLERFIREDLARAFGELGVGQGEPPQPELIFDIHFQGP
jgi:hypothetical protein